MYIELIDLLRCPRQHEDSWLVAAFNRMDGRFVVEGKLGCPVCSATYLINDGNADLRLVRDREATGSVQPTNVTRATDESAMRAAAFLGLAKPNSLVVLSGDSANLSDKVTGISEARVIALNPTATIVESESVAIVLADTRFPFAPSSLDGIILGENTMASLLADSARVLKQGGRLVAPKGTALSGNFRVLASDDRQVVAESIGELISLSR